VSWQDTVTKLIKLKARYFFAAWVFGALLIFLPDSLKQQMNITIPDDVQPWVGFSTLATFVLWLNLILLQVFAYVRKKLSERRIKNETLAQLETLSQRERDVLLQCVNLNQRTIHRNINDSAVNSLRSKGLITIARSGSALSMPFTIPKFVWEYIKANDVILFPELLDETAMTEFDQRLKNYHWMGI
jgi:hypothetical protein